MNSDEITKALYHKLTQKNHKYICPNKHLDNWFECDMISITNSNYLHEYEIKTSRSDFKADFKKLTKHAKLAGEKQIFVERTDNKVRKKMGIPWKDIDYIAEENVLKGYTYNLESLNTPAYFWYVTPVDLLKEDEIPTYAGWMEVRENGYVVERKSAKRLHNIKVDDACKVKILESMAIRYWHLKLK